MVINLFVIRKMKIKKMRFGVFTVVKISIMDFMGYVLLHLSSIVATGVYLFVS